MRPNFATGLLAGVLIASVFVLGAGFSHGIGLFAPAPPVAGPVQFATARSTTTESSTTHATVPSTITALQSNLTASAGAGNNTVSSAATQAAGNLVLGPVGQSPSSLATVVKQPGLIPLLLLPIVAALILGLVLYKASGQKE